MRDTADNTVVVCSIENVDPVGVHTGDSITVAPALTLTDREYQNLRDIGIDIIRAVGVDTGGCNIQFAVDPATGRVIVIEMNPRVSRSSALASKATGFPIAKIAAKLAIGYRLDEIPNDITKVTPASFEPTLDYVVVKVPRFAFEKFPSADATLTTTMKSRRRGDGDRPQLLDRPAEGAALAREAGEQLPLGRRARRQGRAARDREGPDRRPHRHRAAGAARRARPIEEVFEATEHRPLVPRPDRAHQRGRRRDRDAARARRRRSSGTRRTTASRDAQIAELRGLDRGRGAQRCAGSSACARSSRPSTPARASSRRSRRTTTRATTSRPRWRRATGARSSSSAPARTASARASSSTTPACTRASRCTTPGFETIMINCNPETVSTDYDTSDRLYFEPLTLEDVLEVIHAESQSGELVGVDRAARRPDRARARARASRRPACRSSAPRPSAIDLAEERGAVLAASSTTRACIAPRNGTATDAPSARRGRRGDRLPGARAPELRARRPRHGDRLRHPESLEDYFDRVRDQAIIGPGSPLLVDRFLDDAIEIDVDALYDGTELYVGGIMEHIEEAGIHSGDSACTLPPVTLGRDVHRPRCVEATRKIAEGIGVRGLLNVQFAIGAGRALRARGEPARVAAPCRSCRRRSASRSPRRRRSSWSGRSDRRAASTTGMLPVQRRLASCRSTRRSRSRRRCCRSSGSAPARATSSTRCSARRCARPARSWASTRDFPRAFAKSQDAAYGGLPDERHGVRLGRRPRQARDRAAGPAALSSSASTSSRPREPPRCSRATASGRTTVRKYFMGQEADRRRSVDRRAHQRRQGRRRHQHAERPQRARRRLSRSAPRRSPPTSRCSRRSRSWAPRSRRSRSMRGGIRVRSLQDYALDRARRRRWRGA